MASSSESEREEVAEKVTSQTSSESKPAASINSISPGRAIVGHMDGHAAVVAPAEFKVAFALHLVLICRIVSNRRADGEPGTLVVSAGGQLRNSA